MRKRRIVDVVVKEILRNQITMDDFIPTLPPEDEAEFQRVMGEMQQEERRKDYEREQLQGGGIDKEAGSAGEGI